jgi:uncharacterized protein YndB with AHSA1/START domain
VRVSDRSEGVSLKTRPTSTARWESTITIDRPIEDVFDRLTDLGSYGVWMPRTGLFGSCRQTSVGPVDRGTTYIDSTRMGRFHGEVTDFERPSRVTFSEVMRVFGRKAVRSRAGYDLATNGTGTVVHHVADTEMFGVMRLMKPFVPWMSKSERSRVLASLKRSLEE